MTSSKICDKCPLIFVMKGNILPLFRVFGGCLMSTLPACQKAGWTRRQAGLDTEFRMYQKIQQQSGERDLSTI